MTPKKARYTVTVVGPHGDTQEYDFPGVTNIIDRCLAKNGLPRWYYNETVNAVSYLLKKYRENMSGFADVASLHSLINQEDLGPYNLRDKASEAGTAIHDKVLDLTKGKRPKEPANLTSYWKERGWRRENILAAEQVVTSFKHKYAGTLDLVYRDSGQAKPVTLTDVKSGAVRDSHHLQVELYRRAWEEQGGVPIERLSIIQVPRDGKECKEVEVPMTRELEEAADGILTLYEWLTGGKR